jgi:hypothetical protein
MSERLRDEYCDRLKRTILETELKAPTDSSFVAGLPVRARVRGDYHGFTKADTPSPILSPAPLDALESDVPALARISVIAER